MPAGIPIAMAVGSAYGAHVQGAAASKAAKLQAQTARMAAYGESEAAKKAAEVAGAANDATLKFEQEKEGTRKAEWDATQAANLVKFNEDLARRQPYMDMGVGALAQMSRPRPPQAGAAPGAPYKPLYSQTPPPPGTLGDLITKQRGA